MERPVHLARLPREAASFNSLLCLYICRRKLCADASVEDSSRLFYLSVPIFCVYIVFRVSEVLIYLSYHWSSYLSSHDSHTHVSSLFTSSCALSFPLISLYFANIKYVLVFSH